MRGLSYLLILPLLLMASVLAFAAWLWVSTPDPEAMRKCLTTSMYKVKLCPGSSTYVPLNQIAEVAVYAILVSEDAGFYQHNGFDWHEMRESFLLNFASGEFRRGGSTITQQLAKNVFLHPEKSLLRKVREAILTYRIERIFKKKEILERYLNVVEFGNGIFGIKSAAQYYFKKAPADLTPLEASFLAYLLPNPKKYSGVFSKGSLSQFSRKRILEICRRLYKFGKISQASYDSSVAQIDAFPWSGLSIEDDFNKPWDPAQEFTAPDIPLEEELLEEMADEEDSTFN